MNGSNVPVTNEKLYLVPAFWRVCKVGPISHLVRGMAPHNEVQPTNLVRSQVVWSAWIENPHKQASKHGLYQTPRKEWQHYTRDGRSQMLEGRIWVVGQNTLEPFLRLVFLHQPQQLLLLLATSVANEHKNPGGHHDAGGRSGDHRNSAPADPPGLLHGTSNSSSPAFRRVWQNFWWMKQRASSCS